MNNYIEINNHRIGPSEPVYIVAEMSTNHNQSFEQAVRIIESAKKAGADAVKLQTYTPDTLTIDCDNECFRIKGTIWEGKNLYQLYEEAYTPWEWHPKLKEITNDLGLDLFSTPFDDTAVDFLEEMDVPAYKVASSEIVDIPLLRKIARTGKPVIISTGMATLAEIEEAVRTIQYEENNQIALLKCTSAYPAPPSDMNLRTIPHLADTFRVPVGFSDHTLSRAVSVAAVAIGACIIEKHLTLSRNIPGPDSAFSTEPHEFKAMVEAIRTVEKATGKVHYGISSSDTNSRDFRRSLFVVQDMKKGDGFTIENVRSIRPGYGLHTRHMEDVIGRHSTKAIPRGTPLTWGLIG